jgi:hypothetical protein
MYRAANLAQMEVLRKYLLIIARGFDHTQPQLCVESTVVIVTGMAVEPLPPSSIPRGTAASASPLPPAVLRALVAQGPAGELHFKLRQIGNVAASP